MPLIVLLGGARSGKSRLAVVRALASGAPVTYVATGQEGDEEMEERIAAHRAERPEEWTTVEEPIELARAIERAAAADTLVIDCLTLWVANLLGRDEAPETVLAAAREAAAVAAGRPGLTLAVSNEVGLGIVPITPLGRAYRDVLGSVNAIWVEASDEAAFVVAGRTLALA